MTEIPHHEPTGRELLRQQMEEMKRVLQDANDTAERACTVATAAVDQLDGDHKATLEHMRETTAHIAQLSKKVLNDMEALLDLSSRSLDHAVPFDELAYDVDSEGKQIPVHINPETSPGRIITDEGLAAD